MGNFPNLREMFALSNSRTVPVLAIGQEVLVGFDRQRWDAAVKAHGLTDEA